MGSGRPQPGGPLRPEESRGPPALAPGRPALALGRPAARTLPSLLQSPAAAWTTVPCFQVRVPVGDPVSLTGALRGAPYLPSALKPLDTRGTTTFPKAQRGAASKGQAGRWAGKAQDQSSPPGPHHACRASVSLLTVPQPQTPATHLPDSAPERPQPWWEVLPLVQPGAHLQPLLQVTMGQSGQEEDLNRPGRAWRGQVAPRGRGSSLCPGVGRSHAPLLLQGPGPSWARPRPGVGTETLPCRAVCRGREKRPCSPGLILRAWGRCMGQGAWGRPS